MLVIDFIVWYNIRNKEGNYEEKDNKLYSFTNFNRYINFVILFFQKYNF